MAEDKNKLAQGVDPSQGKAIAEQIKAPLTPIKEQTGMSRSVMIVMGIHAAIQTGLMVLQFRQGGNTQKGLIRALQAADAAIMAFVTNPNA